MDLIFAILSQLYERQYTDNVFDRDFNKYFNRFIKFYLVMCSLGIHAMKVFSRARKIVTTQIPKNVHFQISVDNVSKFVQKYRINLKLKIKNTFV